MDKDYTTPTPWVYKYGAVYQEDFDGINTEKRLLLADRGNPGTTPVERDANLRRAAKCVNACHDIEDPDRAHAVARDAIREAHVLLESLLGEVPYRTVRPLVIQRLEHLSEAHALLGGGAL